MEVQWQVCRSRRGVVSRFWGGSPEEEEAELLLCAFMSQDCGFFWEDAGAGWGVQ